MEEKRQSVVSDIRQVWTNSCENKVAGTCFEPGLGEQRGGCFQGEGSKEASPTWIGRSRPDRQAHVCIPRNQNILNKRIKVGKGRERWGTVNRPCDTARVPRVTEESEKQPEGKTIGRAVNAKARGAMDTLGGHEQLSSNRVRWPALLSGAACQWQIGSERDECWGHELIDSEAALPRSEEDLKQGFDSGKREKEQGQVTFLQ